MKPISLNFNTLFINLFHTIAVLLLLSSFIENFLIWSPIPYNFKLAFLARFAIFSIGMLFLFLKKRRLLKKKLYLGLFLLCLYGMLSIVSGMFTSVAKVDVLSDLLRFFAPIITFIFFYLYFQNYPKYKWDFIHKYIVASLLFSLLSIVYKWYMFLSIGRLYPYGAKADIFLIIVWFLLRQQRKLLPNSSLQKRAVYKLLRSKRLIIIESIAFFSALASLSKTFMLQAAVFMGLLFILMNLKQRIIYIISATFLICAISLSNIDISLYLYRFEKLISMISSRDTSKKGDSSSGARLNEVKGVIHAISREPVTLLTGYGSGAVWTSPTGGYVEGLNIKNARLVDGEYYYHHVHIYYAVMLLRYGIIGIAIYTLFIFAPLFKRIKRTRSDESHLNFSLVKGIKFLLLYEILGTLTVNSAYGDYLWGVYLALFWHIVHKGKKLHENTY